MDKQLSALIGKSCNCLALRSAARSLARRYDEAFRPIDLNNGQFSILVAASALQPVSIQELGDRLGMDRTTVTAALKPLQRRNFLVIEVSENDLRGRAVSVTRQGQKLLEKAIPLWKEAQKEVERLVGGEQFAIGLRMQLAAIR